MRCRYPRCPKHFHSEVALRGTGDYLFPEAAETLVVEARPLLAVETLAVEEEEAAETLVVEEEEAAETLAVEARQLLAEVGVQAFDLVEEATADFVASSCRVYCARADRCSIDPSAVEAHEEMKEADDPQWAQSQDDHDQDDHQDGPGGETSDHRWLPRVCGAASGHQCWECALSTIC